MIVQVLLNLAKLFFTVLIKYIHDWIMKMMKKDKGESTPLCSSPKSNRSTRSSRSNSSSSSSSSNSPTKST